MSRKWCTRTNATTTWNWQEMKRGKNNVVRSLSELRALGNSGYFWPAITHHKINERYEALRGRNLAVTRFNGEVSRNPSICWLMHDALLTRFKNKFTVAWRSTSPLHVAQQCRAVASLSHPNKKNSKQHTIDCNEVSRGFPGRTK